MGHGTRPAVLATFASEQACLQDLSARYDQTLTALEAKHAQSPGLGKLEIVREPHRRKWTISRPMAMKPEEFDYTCAPES